MSAVTHVSDTARWVAVYRAMESERPDALFHDPYARRLAGEQGEAIVRALPKGRQMAWPMIVRTALMDEMILRAVADGVDTVLDLATGLDTRPYRLELPAALRWVDADLPGILGYKQEALAHERPRCRLEFAPVDLADAAARASLFDRVAAASRQTLVITEGLLVYLTAEHVAALAQDLHARAPFRLWLLDLASPRLLAMLTKRLGKPLAAGNAPLRFGPAEGTAFFAPHGWREREYRSLFEESLRLNRTFRGARFWKLVSRLYPRRMREQIRRMSGIVMLERT